MAQLDNVTANVYKMCLQDGKVLSATASKSHQADPTNITAWGSSSSIPDLLRQHSQRVTVRHRSRPSSGTITERCRSRSRPASAKVSCPQIASSSGQRRVLVPSVCGEKCEVLERPPEGISQHSVSYGWVAPPGGLIETRTTHKCTSDEFEAALNGVEICSALMTRDESCGLVDVEPVELETNNGGVVKEVKSPEVEHIFFSLPNVSYDVDDSFDTARLFADKTDPTNTQAVANKEKVADEVTSCNKIHEDSQVHYSPPKRTISVTTDPDIATTHTAYTECNASVCADTHRHKVGLISRPPSGRSRHLQYVKSRISSGLGARQQKCNAREAIPIVSLMYDDDDESVETNEKQKKKGKGFEAKEVESVISQLNSCVDATYIAESRPSTATKCVSRGATNYYDVAIGHSADISLKTTTTIALADGETKESKTRSAIEGQVRRCSMSHRQWPGQLTSAAAKPKSPQFEGQTNIKTVDQPTPQVVVGTKTPKITVRQHKPTPQGQRVVSTNPKITVRQHEPTPQGQRVVSTNPAKIFKTMNHQPTPQVHAAGKTNPHKVMQTMNRSKVQGILRKITDQSKAPEYRVEIQVAEAPKEELAAAVVSRKQHNDVSCCTKKSETPADAGGNKNTSKPSGNTDAAKKLSANVQPAKNVVSEDGGSEKLVACRRLQYELLEKNVPVSLETLQRALLPPTEYQPRCKIDLGKRTNGLPNYTDGLLSKPSLWLVNEARKVRIARMRVRRANACLQRQQKRKQNTLRPASSINE